MIARQRSFRRLAPAIVSSLLMLGCVDGPCRKLKNPELAPGMPAAPSASNSSKNSPPAVREAADGRVFVARPDGSLQCGMEKGLELVEMERDLRGIKVYSSMKKPDGKMHIQVCGSPTGILNVYEIPASSLSDAEKNGFKKFND